jgi:hypothetical protein
MDLPVVSSRLDGIVVVLFGAAIVTPRQVYRRDDQMLRDLSEAPQAHP